MEACILRAIMRVLALILLACVPVIAQDAVTIALHVNEPAIDKAVLTTAIASADPLTRATAARVATVRSVTDALPTLRDALAAETNAEAAREQVRALSIIGSVEDVAFAAKHLAKFPASIDVDFSEAIARRGAPQATALYLEYAPKLRRASAFASHALWGRDNLTNVTMAKFLGANDTRALRAMFDGLETALDPGVLSAVLDAPSSDARAIAVWYLVERGGDVPEISPREGASIEEAFGREVLRRMRGAQKEERPEWLEWLRTPAGRTRVPDAKEVRRHLTKNEQKALVNEKAPHMRQADSFASTVLPEPPFRMSIELPPGLAAKLLEHTRCDKAAWIGVATATVDRVGRLQALDLSKVTTIGPCKTALKTMLRLSLADPLSLNAALTSNDVQLVKPPGLGCFDEAPVDESGTGEIARIGGDVVAPEVIQRVEPQLTRAIRRTSGLFVVVVEAVITRTGCVRDVRVVKQSPSGDMNSAVVSAISKWKFKPGTLDGQPVDVLFSLTTSFRFN